DPEVPGDHVDRLLAVQATEDHLAFPLLETGQELRDQIARLDELLAAWIVFFGRPAVEILGPGPEHAAAAVARVGAEDDGRDPGLERARWVVPWEPLIDFEEGQLDEIVEVPRGGAGPQQGLDVGSVLLGNRFPGRRQVRAVRRISHTHP